MSALAGFSLLDFCLFSTICVGTLAYYQYKQFTEKKPEKLPQDDRIKVVVVTGCDRGLGQFMAGAWSKQNGYLVVACTLSDKGSRSFENDNIIAVQCDVTQDDQVKAMKEQVQRLLEERNAVLYSIVNNAGIADPANFLFHDSVEIPKRIMEVNYFGQLCVTQELLPLMLMTSNVVGGKIFNMSSVCGVSSSPGNGSYSASKFAVEAWSDALRLELDQFGIQVVTIRPGQIATGIQSDWISHYVKNFRAAPAQIQNLHGGSAFADKMEEGIKSSIASHGRPELVVDKMTELLLQSDHKNLDCSYFVGSDAKTFWRALYILPTAVVHTIKRSVLTIHPLLPELPPAGAVAHVTITCRDLQKSLTFYKALGFETLGPEEHGCQFLQFNPAKNGKWESRFLLKEDKNMPERQACSDAGMTRICMLTNSVDAHMKELEKHGIKPIASPATSGGMKLVVYKDPDGFAVYFDEIGGLIGAIIGAQLWWNKRPYPFAFHWSMNVTDHKKILPMFEEMGFKTMSDQNKDQVVNGLLPAFNIDADTTVIDWIRLCSHPKDGIVTTIMNCTNPRSSINEASANNAMTISAPMLRRPWPRPRRWECTWKRTSPHTESSQSMAMCRLRQHTWNRAAVKLNFAVSPTENYAEGVFVTPELK
ncbi:Short-chain dehydrogenase/reductase family 9C member 7 [Seminavis robusta]|uniref:Short-chain dehydrogenase/reductase family 9C member 7 n=1 Tax=Seminavis robusta TaxID=568900 RepID=A0A9N8D6I7_9STRA|nr:Short-chain dehydrogenase/reductase family 9C member 7 [Seminavis robusta]|eukprot:Sro17_g012530.1 Short-chain dehydrogenase/reductase family 9C member 7 (648) ;mRNA; r:142282-144225